MRPIALLTNAALSLGIVFALAVNAETSSPREQTAAAAERYVPGLGEIMAAQQMRHAKLWLAGRERNWALASYELDELREGFEDAAKFQPVHDNVPVSAMIAELTPGPLESLSKAVAEKSPTRFRESFDKLTAACNACHRAANHAFIVITRPAASAFRNQVFAPRK